LETQQLHLEYSHNERSQLWPFQLYAEMGDCEDRANGVLVMEPLMEVEMEEWLAQALTFAAREDCTNKKE
jgi:hypothetical protein